MSRITLVRGAEDMPAKPKRRRERLAFRVCKGALAPADTVTQARLRDRGYSVGDLVFAEITKPRNTKYWGLAHRFGDLCAKNVDALSGLSPHAVLKRLQIEADIGCDNIALNFPGVGPCNYRVPLSLGYESMEQGEFHEVFKRFCRFVAAKYWNSLNEDQIAEMAESMVDE